MERKIELFLKYLIFFIILFIFYNLKSFTNIGIGVFGLLSIIKIILMKNTINNKFFYIYFFSFFIGMISNIINRTTSDYISNQRYLLVFIFFMFSNFKKEQFKKMNLALIFGALSSGVYSLISYYTPNFFGIKTKHIEYINDNKRMQSFTSIIRWARLLQIMVLFNLSNITIKNSRIRNIWYFLFGLFLIINVFLNGSRSIFLGILLGLIFLFFMLLIEFRKEIKKYLSVFIIFILGITVFIYNNQHLSERINSIRDFDNTSNRIRLNYYKIGVDILKERPFIGYGTDTYKKVFEDFVNKQSEEYKEKYYYGAVKNGTGTPFENTYLNSAIDNGIIFVLWLNLSFFLILIYFYNKSKELDFEDRAKVLVLMSSLIGYKVFIFFWPFIDNYAEILFNYIIFYIYSLCNRFDLVEENND